MDWTHWLMTERDGMSEFTPYEPHEDGTFDVVTGFCLVTSKEAIIEKGATKIVQVDDIYELGNPRLIYDISAEQ